MGHKTIYIALSMAICTTLLGFVILDSIRYYSASAGVGEVFEKFGNKPIITGLLIFFVVLLLNAKKDSAKDILFLVFASVSLAIISAFAYSR